MSNQIDREKLLRWLKDKLEPVFPEEMAAYEALIHEIEGGTFDLDPPAVPVFHPGDKVTHIDYPEYGIGEVQSIAKSGQRARVEFEPQRWFTPDGYYKLEKLRRVEEDQPHE